MKEAPRAKPKVVKRTKSFLPVTGRKHALKDVASAAGIDPRVTVIISRGVYSRRSRRGGSLGNGSPTLPNAGGGIQGPNGAVDRGAVGAKLGKVEGG